MITPDALAAGLAALGLDARLETDQRQLVIVPARGVPDLTDRSLRAAVVTLAREAGFTHVSLEVPPDATDATLPRHQPA